MTQPQDGYAPVEGAKEVAALMGVLSEPGGASVILEESDGKPLPVLVADQRDGECLLLDISAIREVAGDLKRGRGFRLVGQSRDLLLQTPPLVLTQCWEASGRLLGRCDYPERVEVQQRRAAFRARVKLGMEVFATLSDPEGADPLEGELKDLSLEGCQLELPLTAASRLATPVPLRIELAFPNGTRFHILGNPRHHVVDTGNQAVRAGFQFASVNAEQERQLWYFVCEIEREAARYSGEGRKAKLPSLLFQAEPDVRSRLNRRATPSHATPMARSLSRVAGYLGAEVAELQRERPLNSVQLSRHADRLLALHEEDREELLFATRCLKREPRLVRHGLAVAVHLLDIAASGAMPREIRKALVACAMVHDLGKSLLPGELLEASSFDADQRAALQGHVARLRPRLERCQWLAASVVTPVVERINERLDGSGYPRGLDGAQLGELARLSMVVDAMDALRRDRADRPAWRVSEAYRHLLGQAGQFDRRWVRRYIKHFGVLPIGSLVRFAGGGLGWVRGLDDHGHPARVSLVDVVAAPEAPLDDGVSGRQLERLGRIVEEVPVST